MKDIPSNWTKQNNKLLLATKCGNFKQAIALLNSIGDIAERLQHHPDIGIRNYNEVFVSTTTHEADELTDKDYLLAAEINELIYFDNYSKELDEENKRIEKFGR